MWNAIYKKLWMVILLPLLAGGIAYFFTGKKAGQYKSVAIIEASIPDPPSTDAKTLKEIQEPDQYYDNLMETMKTEVITSMASYRLLLHDLEQEMAFRPPAIQYSAQKKDLVKGRLEKNLSSFELLSETDPTEETIFKVITNMDYNVGRWVRDEQMSIARKPGTNEIMVACSTEDPFLSAFAANALSQEYIRYETAMTAPLQTSDSLGYYRDEVNRLRKDLEQKTSDYNEASSNKSKAPVSDANLRRAKADRIAEVEMRIVEEEWEVNNLRDQMAKMQQPEPSQQKAEPADIATNAKIQIIRTKIDDLSKIYVEGGTKDKKLDSIINRLRKQVNDETVRLQMASQKTAVATADPSFDRNKGMLETRIRRHDDNIQSLRNEIRRLKNNSTTAQPAGTNSAEAARLRREQEAATKAYNLALGELKKVEAKQGPKVLSSRERHHLILKAKALPSAEPESPWALAIVLSAVIGTMTIVLIYIAVTRPEPPPNDDIFLRINYANQQRSVKKKHPREEDVSLSNN